MDYSRFNYVAQPEDNIALDDIVPRIGPYDKFAIMWGYKPIPGARTPDEERPTLDQWARMQDTIPWYRFSANNEFGGYGTLKRGGRRRGSGEVDRARLQEICARGLVHRLGGDDSRRGQRRSAGALRPHRQQWATEAGHVATMIGGARCSTSREARRARCTRRYRRARQEEAMRFINENVFQTPTYLIRPEIARRIEAGGMITRITNAQARVLTSVLNDGRLNRLLENEALASDRGSAYSLASMLDD